MASRRMTVEIELLEELEYLQAQPCLPATVTTFADGYKLHNPNVDVVGFTFGVPTYHHARKRSRSESDSAAVPPAKRRSGAADAAAPQAGSSAASQLAAEHNANNVG